MRMEREDEDGDWMRMERMRMEREDEDGERG